MATGVKTKGSQKGERIPSDQQVKAEKAATMSPQKIGLGVIVIIALCLNPMIFANFLRDVFLNVLDEGGIFDAYNISYYVFGYIVLILVAILLAQQLPKVQSVLNGPVSRGENNLDSVVERMVNELRSRARMHRRSCGMNLLVIVLVLFCSGLFMIFAAQLIAGDQGQILGSAQINQQLETEHRKETKLFDGIPEQLREIVTYYEDSAKAIMGSIADQEERLVQATKLTVVEPSSGGGEGKPYRACADPSYLRQSKQ